jgi:hypothetical protein
MEKEFLTFDWLKLFAYNPSMGRHPGGTLSVDLIKIAHHGGSVWSDSREP